MSQESVPDGNSIERSIDSSELSAGQAGSIDSSELLQEPAATENSIETDGSAASAEQVTGTGQESKPESEPEIVKLMLVGSQRSVFKTIHTLYLIGFAEVGDWSPPQRGAKPGEVVCVLIRRRQT